MENGDFVQLHLVEPREQWFGRLMRLSDAGILLRGIEIRLVESYRYQFQRGEEEVFPQSVFFPMRRVERLYLDEALGEVPSLLDTILRTTGWQMAEMLSKGWHERVWVKEAQAE